MNKSKIIWWLYLILVLFGTGFGYWLGFNEFMKTPTPPYDLTKNAKVYACYVYSSGVVGNCNKYSGEIEVEGKKYYKTMDSFETLELKDSGEYKLFYLINK